MARHGLLPPMRGGWADIYRAFASPWTQWLLLLWIGAWAVVGLSAEPGLHPAEFGAMQVPLIVLPFTILIHGLESGRRFLEAILYAVGLGLICVGGALAGSGPGVLTLGGATAAESYERAWQFGTYERHLGGQIQAELQGEAYQVRIGTGQHVAAQGVIPIDGVAEGRVGPWSMYLVDREPGAEPTRARFSVRPRMGGEALLPTLRIGESVTLPDKTQLILQRLSADYGRALGPAAQLAVTWPDGKETSWYFVEDPGLDARVGLSPWIIELSVVEAPPRVRMAVREAGSHQAAMVGWGLLIMGLLIGLGRPKEDV